MTYCHYTKEQNKKICVDSQTGDLVKVENVPVEQHEVETHENENYTDFFNDNEEGDGVLRNNKVTSKNNLKLHVGITVRTEYGIAKVTKIRKDNIVEAKATGIMKMYLPIEKVQWYLNQNACDKLLQYSMEYDKAHYTKKVNKTLMSTT